MSDLTSIEKEPTDDDKLVEAAKNNPAEFDKLYQRWISPIYRYVYAHIGNRSDAEDLTSQIMLAAFQGFPRYQHRGNFAGWLFTIARNQIWRWISRYHREEPLEYEFVPGLPTDLLSDVLKTEEIKKLREIVLGLPENEKELIYLRYVAGLGFADMGVVLKRREGAVKMSLYRLQDRLQHLLEDYHD